MKQSSKNLDARNCRNVKVSHKLLRTGKFQKSEWKTVLKVQNRYSKEFYILSIVNGYGYNV